MTSTTSTMTLNAGGFSGLRTGRREGGRPSSAAAGGARRTRPGAGTASRSTDGSSEVRALIRLLRRARQASVEGMLADLGGPGVRPDVLASVRAACRPDHEAMLLFPDSVPGVSRFLRACGFDVADPVPSVIVRDRLARRYGYRDNVPEVSILKASIEVGPGDRRGVELFCLPRTQATPEMTDRERRENNEGHSALIVERPEPAALARLDRLFRVEMALTPDGGGYNPHDDEAGGGRTALYFRTTGGRRLELTAAGDHPAAIAAHRERTPAAR